jgi:hypothetical protein
VRLQPPQAGLAPGATAVCTPRAAWACRAWGCAVPEVLPVASGGAARRGALQPLALPCPYRTRAAGPDGIGKWARSNGYFQTKGYCTDDGRCRRFPLLNSEFGTGFEDDKEKASRGVGYRGALRRCSRPAAVRQLPLGQQPAWQPPLGCQLGARGLTSLSSPSKAVGQAHASALRHGS